MPIYLIINYQGKKNNEGEFNLMTDRFNYRKTKKGQDMNPAPSPLFKA
jgi:hypothetical protein